MLIFTIALIVCFSGVSAQQPVTVYGDKDYRPYAYEENGEARGIYVNILREAFAKMPGYDVTIAMLPWKRGLDYIRKGKGIALFPPYHAPDRDSWILFSEPILEEQVIIFGRAETLADKRPGRKTLWECG